MDFGFLSRQSRWFGIPGANPGSRIDITPEDLQGEFDLPDFMRTRSLIFAACANTAASYRALQLTQACWPLAHPITGNIGGVIASSGLALAYYAEDCGCISGDRRTEFPVEFYARDGRSIHHIGHLLRVPSQDRNDPLYGVTNAALIEIPTYRRPRTPRSAPVIRRTLPVPGEPLFAFALVRDQWCLSAGRLLRITEGQGVRQLETTLQVFHGFCGAILFDRQGKWVGWGAKIAGVDEEATRRRKRWTRVYGVGLFDALIDVVPALLSDQHAGEVTYG